MNNKCEKLLSYLNNQNKWISSLELSSLLGVSKRQIANYVSEINANAIVILSSTKGYKISPNYSEKNMSFDNEYSPKQRQRKLVNDLLNNKNGVDIYYEADALFVSTSSLENDINTIKNSFNQFDIKLSKKNDVYHLIATENNIRKFLVINVFHNNLEELFKYEPEYVETRTLFKKIIQNNNLYINDYSLALFTLNVCVCIIRNKINRKIENNESQLDAPKQYIKATKDITQSIEKQYNIKLDDNEVQWIIFILLSSSTLWDPKKINIRNLPNYIEQKYLDITEDVMSKVKQNFPTTNFDDEFRVRFTIHIRNCFMQRNYDTYNIDALTKRIKYNYPIMYEVAVFVADYLDNFYSLKMTQSELTYIAFHICSSLSDFTDYQVTITYVYADYWDYHKKVLNQLMNCIGDNGLIKQSVSISDYVPSLYHSDLIVTDSDAILPEPCVKISSIPTKENTIAISNKVNKLYLQKQYAFFVNNSMRFFNKKLFMIYEGDNYLELIEEMCNTAKKNNYIDDNFFEDVLKREKLDNTAFNLVAIPHTLTVNSLKTFIYVAICKNKIKWNDADNNVFVVTMLGINKEDRKTFSNIYDFLVNILSNNSNIINLSKSQSFEEFINNLKFMANEIED